MKRYLLCLVLTGCAVFLQAADYKYLVLQCTDGSTVDLPAEGLSLTFSEGQLVASNGTTVPLTSLSQMFFSQESTGIATLSLADAAGPVDVFSPTGALLGRFGSVGSARTLLPVGVYVVKGPNRQSFKIVVK